MSGMLALPVSSVPRTLAQTLTELPFGSQSQIRVRDGQLSAFLAYVGFDRRVGTAKYALRVLNNTPAIAFARLFVDAKGTQVSAYPCDIEIAPYSMRDDVIPVRMDVTGPFNRAIVAVSSDDNYFTVEAPPPPRERPNWLKWGALAMIPVFAGGAAQAYRPRILDVSAPKKAVAGTVLQVPYQVAGVGSVEYDFQTRDGLRLAAGLGSKSGVLNLQIPRGGAGAPYQLRVRMRNAFSHSENIATIAAVVPGTVKAKPALAPGASIEDLSVTPSPVVAGKTIAIRYATQAESGEVFLVDSFGMTWAHAPMSVTGSTQLSVPQAAAGKDMRVVLHVQRGKAHAESSVGVAVMPSQQTVAQTTTEPTAAPAATAQPAAAPTLTLSSQVVSPGDTVTASISGVHSDVRITLMSSGGATLAQGDAEDGTGVTLNAPNVSTPTTFFVVATLTNGVAQQSIVKRLVVTPR
jgi:hypothetical protein